jgi:outer membrane protein assembly factor BamB
MAGLAEALRDIHRVGVVHRDLKPSNVLLAEDGPKVIDFGISRPKDSELHTETGKLIGTPPFMAPEQFRRPREVGPAADVFALGSVLVHAATGRGPFDSDSPYVVAYQVVHDDPDLTGVPESLAPMVLRCLAKKPEDRPTPDELMQELRSVAASYDTQAFIPAQRAPGGDVRESGSAGAAEPVESSKPSKPSADEDSGTSEVGARRRGLRRQVALALGALLLVVGGGFACVQAFGEAAGGAARGPDGSRSAADAFAPWATRPAGADGLPKCAYEAQRLICAQLGWVSALDASDGRELWRHALSPDDKPREAPVVAGGLAHVLTHSGKRVEAFDPASGKMRWERDVSTYGGVRYAGGTLLLTAADGTVTGVDAASGRTAWSRRIPGVGDPYFVSFPGDSLVYATSTSGEGRTRVTAVDPATGDVRWDERFDGALTLVGAAEDSVVLLAEDGDGGYGMADAVVRFSPETKVSRRVALSVALQQPSAAVHGHRVYLMTYDGALVAVDTREEKLLWSLQTAVSRGSVPTVDGTHVYFSAPDGRLLAVDAEAGKLVGQTELRFGAHSDEVVSTLPAPEAADGRIYAGAPDGTVFAVDGRDPSGW